MIEKIKKRLKQLQTMRHYSYILKIGELYPRCTEQNVTQHSLRIFGMKRLLYLMGTISENSHSHTQNCGNSISV
jgi:sulfur transfer protein SufE